MLALVIAVAGCDTTVGLETGFDTSAREPTPSAPIAAVVSRGVVQLVPDGGPPIDVVHVRVTITGTGDRPTTALASAATVSLAGRAAAGAIAANGNLHALPVVIVEPGHREPVDLYFPVAAGAAEGDRYIFAWTLDTPSETLAVRETAPLGEVDAAAPVGSGRYWWFSTSHAWPTFRIQDGVITPKPPIWAEIKPATAASDDEPRSKECEDW